MTSAINSDLLQNIGLGGKPGGVKKDELSQEAFLKLMTTQLNNQDPFKPMESGDFLGQIAQFGTVSGIQDLQKSFEQFSSSIIPSQGLQAASLINRNVLVASDISPMTSAGLKGAIELPAPATDVQVSVYSGTGQVLNSFSLGPVGEGISRYQWDGVLPDGTTLPAGQYKVAVDAVIDGDTIAVKNFADLPVDSISFGGKDGGINVNVRGLGTKSFSEILQIS